MSPYEVDPAIVPVWEKSTKDFNACTASTGRYVSLDLRGGQADQGPEMER